MGWGEESGKYGIYRKLTESSTYGECKEKYLEVTLEISKRQLKRRGCLWEAMRVIEDDWAEDKYDRIYDLGRFTSSTPIKGLSRTLR